MDLLTAMENRGLVVRDLKATNDVVRCGTRKKPGGKNGWYIIYEDGKAAIFGNWEDGDGYEYWQDGEITLEQREKIKKAVAKADDKRTKEREAVADKAAKLFESYSDHGFSEYLDAKGIEHGSRNDTWLGVRYDNDQVVVPVRDMNDKIWSLQSIEKDGSKRFMYGGKIKGNFHTIGDDFANRERVVVCEGLATGATIFKQTGYTVYVAFFAGNLQAVAEALPFNRDKIIIAADNDESGAGERFARDSGFEWVMPDKEGDFNDHPDQCAKLKPDNIEMGGTKIVGIGDGHGDGFYCEFDGNEAVLVGGMVGRIAQWIIDTAIMPQPKLSLSAALAFVSMLKGHRISGATDLRTNLLMLNLAETQAGKEHPQACLRLLAKHCDLTKHMMGEPKSGGGLVTAIKESENLSLLLMDEVGRWMETLTSSKANSSQQEIPNYIIKLFSCADTYLQKFAYVDTKKNDSDDINNPHFCCLGSSVIQRFTGACSSTEIIDGFLNRWIVFHSTDTPSRFSEAAKNRKKDKTPPKELVAAIKKYIGPQGHRRFVNSYGSIDNSLCREVGFTPEAWEIFWNYGKEVEGKKMRAGYPLNSLIGRNAEHVEKIALTLCDDEFIGIHDVKAAIAIVEQSSAAMIRLTGLISDNENEREYLRLRDLIKDAGTMPKNVLTRKTQWLKGGNRRREEILKSLEDDGVVVVSNRNTRRHVITYVG